MEDIDVMVFVFVLLAGMLKKLKWNMLAAALLWLLPAWLPCRSRDFVTLWPISGRPSADVTF